MIFGIAPKSESITVKYRVITGVIRGVIRRLIFLITMAAVSLKKR